MNQMDIKFITKKEEDIKKLGGYEQYSKSKFEKFIEDVSNKQIVPLIGSGVSIKAQIPCSKCVSIPCSGEIPVSYELNKRISKLIFKKIFGNKIPTLDVDKLLNDIYKGNQDIDKIKNNFIKQYNTYEHEINTFFAFMIWKDSMSKLSEIAVSLCNGDFIELCDALEIASWAHAKPKDAHKYIVMLAVESFIEEIITTNYDCCIENACEKLGFTDYAVITKADELYDPKHSFLRLYKINGDARNLKKTYFCVEAKVREAEQIILTEAQLQGQGNVYDRSWVEDLLKNIVRSKAFVFSGFGSDEPQIWFVIKLILKELSVLKKHGNKKQYNRLWLDLYEKSLSFHLVSALLDNADLQNKNILAKDEAENIFSGYDYKFFNSAKNDALDADAFWKKTWEETVFKALLKKNHPVVRRFVSLFMGHEPDSGFAGHLYGNLLQQYFDIIEKSRKKILKVKHYKQKNSEVYISFKDNPNYWMTLILFLYYKSVLNLNTNLNINIDVDTTNYKRVVIVEIQDNTQTNVKNVKIELDDSSNNGNPVIYKLVDKSHNKKRIIFVYNINIFKVKEGFDLSGRIVDQNTIPDILYEFVNNILHEVRTQRQTQRNSRRKKK